MIDSLYRPHGLRRFPPLRLLVPLLASLASFALALDPPIDTGIYRDSDPALGISDDFGRWDGTIRLVYDPDGAPAAYRDTSKVLALIREAYSCWTLVSGVHVEIAGVDARAPDDRDDSPFERDGLVRVSWGNLGGAAGRAGPTGSFFDEDLGYFPFDDGSVELSNVAGAIDSDFEFVNVLVHEFGHLLGLGHSDVPDSVMYANPYNYLRYPRADDIRAVQVLYGAPAQAMDPGAPIPAWLYSPPRQASATATQFLFKANMHPSSGSGAYFDVGDRTVTTITNATDDDEVVWFVGGIGGGPEAIDVAAKLIVVDPMGYQYAEQDWTLSCPSGSACVRGMMVGYVSALKTLPGTWKVYVVNPATDRTLANASLAVSGAPAVNRAPTATITAVPGNSAARARFTLTASDPDGDDIEVVWHPPGLDGQNSDVRHRFASGGSTSLDIDFAQAGTRSFFVEVRDDAARYGDGPDSSAAGEGFQTLLRVTVSLPAASLQVVSTQDRGILLPTPSAQQVLEAIAATPITEQLRARDTATASDVPATTVGFRLGASSNAGTSVRTSFGAGENVTIAGSVLPRAEDVGRAANIYVVVRTAIAGAPERWTYLNSDGDFVDWNTKIADLLPAYGVTSLRTSEAFEVFSGRLVPATHRIHIGYRLDGGTTLFYTGQAHTLSVSE